MHHVGRIITPAVCSVLARSRPLYVTCTRLYAHKRPSSKPKPPKPHTKGGKKNQLSQGSDDVIDESDVVWQDDPDYEEKMDKLYPNRDKTKDGEDIEEHALGEGEEGEDAEEDVEKKGGERAEGRRMKGGRKQKAVEEEEEDDDETFDGNDKLYPESNWDIFDEDLGPVTEAEKKKMKDTKVYFKQVIEKSSDSKTDMTYIERTFKKNENSTGGGGWQEWKDDEEEVERQRKAAVENTKREEEDEEAEETQKPKQQKEGREREKPVQKEKETRVAHVRRNPDDLDQLYVGTTKIPDAYNKYFEDNFKIPEKKEKEPQPLKSKKRRGFREQFQLQPKIRQLRIATVIQEILDSAIYENTTYFSSNTAKIVNCSLIVSGVEMTRDMRFADVFWYVELPEKRKEFEKRLIRLRPYLRKQLATHMHIKFVPDLRFFYTEQTMEEDQMDHILERERIRVYGGDKEKV